MQVMTIFLRSAAALVFLAAALVVCGLAKSGPIVVHVGAGVVKSDLPELASLAKAIAIVQVVADPSEHWNSADNKSWGTLGEDSLIYRDVPVKVVSLVDGELPSTLTLRDLGGTADGYLFEVDGTGTWTVGSQYLVFVTKSAFPTREGSEDSWTPVRLGQGVFSVSGQDWYEPIQGIRIPGDRVQDVVSLLPSH